MKYTPYSEAEIQSMNVIEPGIYHFQVMDVDTQDRQGSPLVDKNGNEMAKLKLCVWDKDQRERIIFTYISGDGNFAYKLRHFAKSIGMIEDYESNQFNIHKSIDKQGEAEVVVKKGTLKNDGSGEMWPDRNDIKDFVCDIANFPDKTKKQVFDTSELDDEVPF